VTARAFWTRVAISTALAASLWLAVTPPRPPRRTGDAVATALGAAAGAALFALVLRRPPALAHAGGGSAAVGKQLVFGLCAANEEVLWRRVLLGDALPAGGFAALALSSMSFALAHRRARCLHAVTGATFGGLYLATGSLAASIAAHWVYNALVGSVAKRRPP
jgi:membrane protease YdiL (CAAX protease family)